VDACTQTVSRNGSCSINRNGSDYDNVATGSLINSAILDHVAKVVAAQRQGIAEIEYRPVISHQAETANE
jgi:hypothetical protein